MAYTNEQLGKALEDLTAAYNNFVEKAKEAAIAAMGDTVVKQIKQDAKDFIAAELKTQRDTLMQAIENAKIALRNSAVEAGNNLEQRVGALITTAENALKEKTAKALNEIKTTQKQAEAEYEDLAERENAKLKKTAASSKLETENAVLQAKKDLEEQGKAISLKIGGEMKEQLDTLGEVLGKKITEAKAGIEGTFVAETKKISEKLELEMLKLRDILVYENADNTIVIKHNDSNKSLSLLMKIKNLKNGLLKNEEGEIVPVGYDLALNKYFNVEKFCKNKKDYCEIHTNTVVSMHFPDLMPDSNVLIKIHNFYFLEHIHIPLNGTEWGKENDKKLKEQFDITDCPNFKGFKKID
jgi:hypothetical protein